MVDDQTQTKFTGLYETKNVMVETNCEQFHKWKQSRLNVKYLQCENKVEDENIQTRAQISDWKLGITFGCTGRDIPH